MWAKGFNANDIHKEMIPVSLGSVCGQSLADDDETKARKSKDFYTAGFDALVKRWIKRISFGGGYVEI
jgi:hypothetical protein